MNLPNLNYVIGNVNSPGQINEKQMEAKDPTQVEVANTANSNKEEDKWSIVPAPKDGAVVSFRSEKFETSYLGVESSALSTANLQANATEFRLTVIGKDGSDDIYHIQPIGGSPDCAEKYLTMDDPKGGTQITLSPKMSNDTHKQKWKFKNAPTGDAGAN